MSKKWKQYSAEYKTKVVLELLSGDQTVAQVASKYDITAKSLGDWKKQFFSQRVMASPPLRFTRENASLAFDVSGATKAYKDEIETLKEENDALAKKLGKTTIERDWAVGCSKAEFRRAEDSRTRVKADRSTTLPLNASSERSNTMKSTSTIIKASATFETVSPNICIFTISIGSIRPWATKNR